MCYVRCGETCSTWRGHPGLQNPRTLTLNSGRSRVRTRSCVDKTDREPSSPKWTASRFDAGQSLQPIQWEFEEHDPRHWQCGSTSNCARPLQKCNAPTAYLFEQKALKIVHVEFACVTRKPCAGWIENDSIPYRFRITWLKKGTAFTELDMENLRSRPTITRPSTHGNDAERGKMPQVKIIQEFYTDFWGIRSTFNHNKKLDGMKQKCEERDGQIGTWRSLLHVDEVRALPLCIKLEHST